MNAEHVSPYLTASAVYAAMTSYGCRPSPFEFTPQSSNAHWAFDQGGLGKLHLFAAQSLLNGSKMQVLSGANSKVIDLLVTNKFIELFSPSEVEAPPEEIHRPFLLEWKGHFSWETRLEKGLFSTKSVDTYAFELVGLSNDPSPSSQPPHALIIPVLEIEDATPSRFLARLAEIYEDFSHFTRNRNIEPALRIDIRKEILLEPDHALHERYRAAAASL
jgi:hypothetical protein